MPNKYYKKDYLRNKKAQRTGQRRVILEINSLLK